MDRLIAFVIAILVALHLIDRSGGVGTPIRRYKFHKQKGKFKPINDTFIDLRDKRLSDISDLSERTAAVELILSNNRITDISPLTALTDLKRLYLDHNKIADLSPLGEMPNLEYLVLSYNQIEDISPLYGLTNLRNLKLKGNTISEAQTEEIKSVLRECQIYI
jgi:hypothetical protein